MEALDSHYIRTEGTLLHLLTGAPQDKIGVAIGLSKILRSTIKSLSSGLPPGFPKDLLDRHKVSDLTPETLKPVVKDLVAHGISCLDEGLASAKNTSQFKNISDYLLYTVLISLIVRAKCGRFVLGDSSTDLPLLGMTYRGSKGDLTGFSHCRCGTITSLDFS